MARFVVGVAGASGVIIAYRLVRFLAEQGHEIELVFTPSGLYTSSIEMDKELSTPQKWSQKCPGKINIHAHGDNGATICSGSYPVDAMLIVPCSMSTVAALAVGLSDNCLRRAADVTLKERRPLILVPRETPLSEIHLENMLRLAKRGVTILPPVPGWYTLPQTVEEVENFIVGKIVDQLHLPHTLYKRWEGC